MISICLFLLSVDILLVLSLWRYVPSYILLFWLFENLAVIIKSSAYYMLDNYSFSYIDGNQDKFFYALSILLVIRIFRTIIFINAPDLTKSIKGRGSKSWVGIFLICSMCLVLMFLLSGVQWLPGIRTTTMSTLNPMLRPLFPVLLFSSGILSFLSIIDIFTKEKERPLFVNLFLLLLAIFLSAIISQRGLLISGALIAIIIHLRKRRIKIVTAVIFLLFFVLISSLIRGGGETDIGLILRLATSPDGTQLDSLVVAIDYVNTAGMKFTILNDFLSIFPLGLRRELGVSTTSDLLNYFWVGEAYYEYGFGYNFFNYNAYIISFGVYLGVFLYIISLLLIRLFLGEFIKRYSFSEVYLFPIFITLQTLIWSYATIHWVIYIYIIAFMASILGKVRIKR